MTLSAWITCTSGRRPATTSSEFDQQLHLTVAVFGAAPANVSRTLHGLYQLLLPRAATLVVEPSLVWLLQIAAGFVLHPSQYLVAARCALQGAVC